MTIRALGLGMLLALAIVSVTYFNDQIVRQTFLINHHLPAPVFVFGFILLLCVNPLMRRLGVGRPLSLGEVSLILALGLAVCGWPGTSFFRYFTHMFILPAHQEMVQPAWQANQVLAYVPGEHGRLGAGYLRDPVTIQQRLNQATPEHDRPAYRFAQRIPITDALRDGRLDARQLANLLQQAIGATDLADDPAFDALPLPARVQILLQQHRQIPLPDEQIAWLNRQLLEATFPDELIPLRRGRGVLPVEGRVDSEVFDPLLLATARGEGVPSAAAVPWGKWWPTIRLWGGAAVLTALAVLCLMVIVHPQWSRRELLPYPTVRLVEELARPRADSPFPAVLSNRMFWLGFLGVVCLHALNGLHAWFPILPEISRQLDLRPLSQLFPNASRATGFWHLVHPTLYPTAIGFAFLISTRVAFSVGLALPLWVLFSAFLIGMGVNVSNHRNAVESLGPSLRFGAFVGVGLMIFYWGRHYYLSVIRTAAGGRRREDVPSYAPWAARGLVLFSALASLLLWRYAGIDLWLAGLVLGMVLLSSLVLARLNAEAGLFYVQPDWYPVMMLLAFLGTPAIGPELMVGLLIASFLLTPDPREGIAPFLINALRLADATGPQSPRRSAPWLGLVLVGGFVGALVVTLSLQYHYGLSMQDHWAPTQAQSLIEPVSNAIAELASRNELSPSLQYTSLERLQVAQPSLAMVGWMGLGLLLVLGCMALGLRLPWWPIHPVIFVIWGTFPSYYFGVSFLIGALVKWAVVHLAGERAFHVVKPLMIGLIVADLTMIVSWAVVGATYFMLTGLPPEQHHILPL